MDARCSRDSLAHRFVMALLQTGLSLSDGLASLICEDEELASGDENVEVLLDMTAGSIAPALRSASEEDVELAIELIVAARERFVADLRLSAEIAGRRERMQH